MPEQEVSHPPDPGVVARIVTAVYELCRADESGELADYIPELAAAQPDSFGIIESDEAVDRYFRQCSLDVTCRDLAVTAATLVNNGLNPCTRERALSAPLTERVRSGGSLAESGNVAGFGPTSRAKPTLHGQAEFCRGSRIVGSRAESYVVRPNRM